MVVVAAGVVVAAAALVDAGRVLDREDFTLLEPPEVDGLEAFAPAGMLFAVFELPYLWAYP